FFKTSFPYRRLSFLVLEKKKNLKEERSDKKEEEETNLWELLPPFLLCMVCLNGSIAKSNSIRFPLQLQVKRIL
ncbi:unnamed protein product, partial [Brassica oleracea var. botrytis]